MTTEELRESVANLRNGRASLKPVAKAKGKKSTTPKAPPMSAEDKALVKTLGSCSPEKLAKIKAKLGM